MGCTSSAPASIPSSPHANATVMELEESPQKKLNATESNGNKISVSTENIVRMELPSCDKLVDDQVVIATVASANESSSIVDPPVVMDDIIEGVDSMDEISKSDQIDQSLVDDDRLSRLDEVVEKVVELFINDHAASSTTEESSQDKTEPENGQPGDVATTANEDVEKEGNEASSECASASPSQSASSRATRWEALADIAAELPPSVAVDPLTGQFYALSK